MSITLTVFIIVCSLFAFRGAMLGIIAWLTRILGLLSGYLLAFFYRQDLAHIASIYLREWSPMLLQVICGFGLFFIGTVLVNMFISSLLDLLRKSHKKLNALLKNKTTTGRVLGAACNSVLGAFFVFIGIWAYGIGHSFQWVPALPENNQNMQNVANKIGQTSFGFLLATMNSTSSNIAAQSSDGVNIITLDDEPEIETTTLAPALTLEELRQKVHAQETQENMQTATETGSSAQITLMIEDVQGHANSNVFSAEKKTFNTNQNSSLQALLGDDSSKKDINNKIQNVLQNKALLTATLRQYMSEEQAQAAGAQLQNMMKDPAMQKMMQENIQQLLNNPAALQEMLQNRKN